jgi:threonine/homoserine/homoserine lactone efflux protein
MKMNDRPTSDLIVFFLTLVVGVVVIIVLIGTYYMAAQGEDPGEGITWVARITNTIVGGVFGYLAGRSVKNGNGNGSG